MGAAPRPAPLDRSATVMRHRYAGYRFSMDIQQRRALFRNLAIALFTHGQITTTLPKARAVKGYVEKIITTARKGDLASRRRVIQKLGDPIVVPFDLKSLDRKALHAKGYKVNKYHELQNGPRLVKKIFDEIAPKYQDRPGGYTRIIKLAKHRIGDGSDLVVLQLVGREETGPQVSGQFSRRRQKADGRTAYAAQLRKAKAQAAEAAPKAEAAPAAGGEEAKA